MGSGPPVAGHPSLACTFGQGPLPEAVRTGILEAVADERAADRRYAEYATRFGAPFPRLGRAEERHADLLEQLLSAHGQPATPTEAAAIPTATDTAQACQVSLDAEKANVALYDRLLSTSPPEDVRCVFQHLRTLSAERHVPALERCVAGAAAPVR